MSLLDTIKAETTSQKPACGIGRILAELPAEDVADLGVALAEKSITGTTIASALSKHLNRRIGEDMVRRHRRGSCACNS